MTFERADTEVIAVALELDLAMDEVSRRDMAVTAATEFALDTLRGAGVVTTELDRDTDCGGCIGPEEGVDE